MLGKKIALSGTLNESKKKINTFDVLCLCALSELFLSSFYRTAKLLI